MLGFSHNYYIIKNFIKKKDDSIYYVLPEALNEEIRIRDIEQYDPSLQAFLVSKGIVTEDSCYSPFIKDNTPYNNFRLFVQLTGNCNLKCKHCFLGGSSNSSNYYTLDLIKSLLLDATRMGIIYIDFTGGEIFTVDFLPELLEFIDSLPISSALFTNLAFLSDKQLDMIIKCSSIRRVITSVDYFRAEKHDSFRGAVGAFRSTMRAIHVLRKAGISVTVNCMILKDNHEDIKKMMEYFPRIGVSLHFDTVICKGNAAKNCDMFNQSEHLEDIQFIFRCVENLNLSKSLLEYMENDKCGVGESLLYVDKNGDFQICPGLTKEDNDAFYLGRRLEDAAAGLLRMNIVCKDMDCKYHSICSFGCRERALKETGSIYSPDYGVCELLRLLEEDAKR